MLKGLAIFGVMAQHAFSPQVLHDGWDTLWIGQAVPVFFVIMGLNAAPSIARRLPAPLTQLYNRRYWTGRFERLVAPILWIWPVALVLGLLLGVAHIGPLIVVGVLPLANSPGNYFITIMLEFAVLFPAVYWCFARWPVITTVVVAIADVGFELLAVHVHALGASGPAHGYIYSAAIPKYGLAIMAGVWLSRLRLTQERLAVLTVLAAGSLAYLVVLHQRPGGFSWLVDSFSESTNFLSVFWAVWLTVVGMRLLQPRSPGGLYRFLERIGRASYHVFLVQIVWFGIVANRSWPLAIVGMVLCALIGHAFFQLMEQQTSPLHALRRRRRAPERSPA